MFESDTHLFNHPSYLRACSVYWQTSRRLGDRSSDTSNSWLTLRAAGQTKPILMNGHQVDNILQTERRVGPSFRVWSANDESNRLQATSALCPLASVDMVMVRRQSLNSAIPDALLHKQPSWGKTRLAHWLVLGSITVSAARGPRAKGSMPSRKMVSCHHFDRVRARYEVRNSFKTCDLADIFFQSSPQRPPATTITTSKLTRKSMSHDQIILNAANVESPSACFPFVVGQQ
ncbi:hypothetical protein BDV97DRAFT_168633 [Delphinella strobiligena]|nr:hypothetical protein BDV97DRAFT_168633 [Delphinella strobiligena]